jgi:hypothetical protein
MVHYQRSGSVDSRNLMTSSDVGPACAHGARMRPWRPACAHGPEHAPMVAASPPPPTRLRRTHLATAGVLARVVAASMPGKALLAAHEDGILASGNAAAHAVFDGPFKRVLHAAALLAITSQITAVPRSFRHPADTHCAAWAGGAICEEANERGNWISTRRLMSSRPLAKHSVKAWCRMIDSQRQEWRSRATCLVGAGEQLHLLVLSICCFKRRGRFHFANRAGNATVHAAVHGHYRL